MIRLYNSKTLKLEEFKSIHENEVSIYVCGPTVYNDAHVGNARPMIVFDTLRRLFLALGYRVKFVSNYTDVDDKIIQKALIEKVPESQITQRYIAAYALIREQLHVMTPDALPKVTETMNKIIVFIQQLVDTGHAYIVDKDVYFAIDSVDDYGCISNQKLDELQVGSRIEDNPNKHNPLDFVLWKHTQEGIQWDSPWGKGRPGWHSECVVMINDQFHGKIDIHGGGIDLKFPHHENEVAQNRAIHHNSIANYWMHNAMVNMDGEKMSKSLGNVFLTKDAIASIGADYLRFFMNGVHYRKELNFTLEALESSKKELDKIKTALKQANLQLQLNDEVSDAIDESSWDAFLKYLCDDLNTPNAYTVLYDIVKKINGALRSKPVNFKSIAQYVNTVYKMLEILGVHVDKKILTDEDKALYKQWELAKSQKDFEKADSYRNQLIERGIL